MGTREMMHARVTFIIAVLAFCACQSGAEAITAADGAGGHFTDGLGEAVYGSGAAFASGAFASGKVPVPNMVPKLGKRLFNAMQKKTLEQARVKAIKAKEAALKAKLVAKKKAEKAKKAAEKEVKKARRLARKKKEAAGKRVKVVKAKLKSKEAEGKAKVEKEKQKALAKGREMASKQKDRLRRRKQEE